ncbi:MAG: LysR family transcriptional regulator [Lentisphaeria bacterium]
MEIRVLKYFLAVVREGNVTRAAQSLHLTQPTLSRQLIDLEDQLGQKLFIRSNHKISLTAEGVLLKKRAEEIIELVQKTEAEFSAIGDTISGNIFIGGGETDGMRQIAAIAQGLQKDYPEIRYHIYSGNAEDVTQRLDKGVLDFGILIQPVDLSKYNYITLSATDLWGVAMKSDSLLAQKKSINCNDLLNLPLICSRQALQNNTVQNEYTQWFGSTWKKLKIVATYNLIFNAALLVEEGMGYAITLDKLLNITGSGKLCFRPLEPRLESKLNLVWKKDQIFSTAAQYFLDRVREELQE